MGAILCSPGIRTARRSSDRFLVKFSLFTALSDISKSDPLSTSAITPQKHRPLGESASRTTLYSAYRCAAALTEPAGASAHSGNDPFRGVRNLKPLLRVASLARTRARTNLPRPADFSSKNFFLPDFCRPDDSPPGACREIGLRPASGTFQPLLLVSRSKRDGGSQAADQASFLDSNLDYY